MKIEIPNIGILEVQPNNQDGTPSFFVKFNEHTIMHAEMDLVEEKVKVSVWPEECFKDEESMGEFQVFEYPAGFKGDEE